DISVDEYISETYGDYCGYATLEKMMVQSYTARNYYQQRAVEQKATDEEIDAYYKAHAEDYLEIPFAYLQMTYDENSQAETLKKAEKYAKEIKSVDDLKKLIPTACADLIQQYLAYGYFENAEEAAEELAKNVETTITKSETSFTADGINWLFSDDTKVGACSSFVDEENSVIYVVLKTGKPSIHDDELYSVRHILIMPESADKDSDDEKSENEEVTYTDAEWAEAEKKAKDILDEFNSGDKTEYAFALLAEKYSDDTESTSNGSSGLYGGLYAGTQLGLMVPSFEKWSTDDSRKYGDVDIVKSDYGYHIMYFIEDTKAYLYDCEQAVISEKEEEFIESMEVKKHKKAMSKTTVAKPTASSSNNDESEDMNY
ncbi:MAG: peptidylprolyl isomerase, partial [Eubacterium sp.]